MTGERLREHRAIAVALLRAQSASTVIMQAANPFSLRRLHLERIQLRRMVKQVRIDRSNVIPIALVAAAAIAVGDFITGIEITFTLLYLVPIALAAWYRGRVFGACVAVASAMSATATELALRHQSGRPIYPLHVAWNHSGSLAIFVVFVLIVGRLRRYQDQERAARRTTMEQLRQAERLGVVGQLAAGLAHELGTPLNVIVGHAELIDGGSPSSATLHVASNAILAQTERMSKIVRGLLDFSRHGNATKSAVDVAALVENAAALVRPIARKNGVAIEVHLAAHSADVTVHGDRTELEQVVVNLMVNAVQAMPHGGNLRVVLRTEPRRGSVPPMACVDVDDDGVGIPAENLSRIFDPFFTTKDVGAGTGLGLSVSYGIISDHQGRIVVSSVVGSGSRFTVSLPLRGEGVVSP